MKPLSEHIVISHASVTLEMKRSKVGGEEGTLLGSWEHRSVLRHVASISASACVLVVCPGFSTKIGVMIISTSRGFLCVFILLGHNSHPIKLIF